jgi:DNA replication protein DnaC
MRVKDATAATRLQNAIRADVERYLLLGPAGIGKSSLSVAALKPLCYRRRTDGLFADAYAIAIARQTSPLGEEPLIVRRAFDVGVLALDDLGAEPLIGTSAIPELIHRRHADGRVTIVSSGFPLAHLEQRYGAGIFRRLTEGAEVISMSVTRAR